MGLFGLSKKERDLNTLSEKEIQLKLYGHLRAPHAASHDKAAVASNKPIQPVIVGPQVRTFDERKHSQVSNISTESTSSRGRNSATLKTEKRDEEDDLFLASSGQSPKHKEHSSETPRTSKSEPYTASAKIQKPSRINQNIALQITEFFLKKFLPVAFHFIKSIFAFIFQLIAALIGFISGALLKVDFKNPKMRRVFSWTLAIGILAFLLVGIHILNFKREIAMKHPKKVSVTKISSIKKRDTIPQQVAKQTLAGDSSTQTSAAQTSVTTPLLTASLSDDDSALSEVSVEAPSLQKGQVIQIATFAVLSDAEKLVLKLKQSGWPCFAKPLVRPGGKTYFCVFLGAFKTYQEAETKLAEFKKKEISKSFQDSFIRSL